MKFNQLATLFIGLSILCACKPTSQTQVVASDYFDKAVSDTTTHQEALIAVTDEEQLQYGARVAYLNPKGDTIIPFGQYAYLGTDTLIHLANVMEFPNDSAYGKWIAIDRNQHTLYELVSYDIAPDVLREGLVRVKRNGLMGFANAYGQIVIPCTFFFAEWFENGKAKVTYEGREVKDHDNTIIESEEWFYIDKSGVALE